MTNECKLQKIFAQPLRLDLRSAQPSSSGQTEVDREDFALIYRRHHWKLPPQVFKQNKLKSSKQLAIETYVDIDRGTTYVGYIHTQISMSDIYTQVKHM